MTSDETLKQDRASPKVLTLRVEVTSGPDAGKVHSAGAERISIGTADGNDCILSDRTVSRFHVDLTRLNDGILVSDQGSTNGTTVAGMRVLKGIVAPGTRIALGGTEIVVRDDAVVPMDCAQSDTVGGLRGKSAAMRRLMSQIERGAQSPVGVLILGESGTGKELIARALHELGPRAKKPFVTVDCGALAPTLVASELFGHERGAFTGADPARVGAIENADGGTLFLDEIGELPSALQPALLGALERRRIKRLGGKNEIPVDVRVVCATHRDLRAEVNAGTFRLDLFYRVAVVRLEVPPLRERAEDIPVLISHFLREGGHDGPIEEVFSRRVVDELARHRWPGNVRELRNVVEATLAMGEPPLLSTTTRSTPAEPATEPLYERPYKDARASVLADFERGYLTSLLERTGDNVSRAARAARMDRSHLIDLIARHGLKPK